MNVLSSPRIATMNNQKAVIKVGTDEFFVTDISSTTVTGAATTTSPSIELTPFFSGVALDVTPQISEQGEITLHVHPSVSRVEDQIKSIEFGTDDTTLTVPLARSTVREADSIVRARNGQVVVIGGRYLGMEIAYDLAEKGKSVILTTRSLLGRDMERNLYLELRNRLIEKGVQLLQNSPLVEIGEDGVYVAFNGDLVFLKADTVVLATGMKSENSLAEALKDVVPEVHSIGDAVSPRDALDAIHEGAQVAREI